MNSCWEMENLFSLVECSTAQGIPGCTVVGLRFLWGGSFFVLFLCCLFWFDFGLGIS